MDGDRLGSVVAMSDAVIGGFVCVHVMQWCVCGDWLVWGDGSGGSVRVY